MLSRRVESFVIITFALVLLIVIVTGSAKFYTFLKDPEPSVDSPQANEMLLEEFRQELAQKIGPEWGRVSSGDLVRFQDTGDLAVIVDFTSETVRYALAGHSGLYPWRIQQFTDQSPTLISHDDPDYEKACLEYVRQVADNVRWASGIRDTPAQQD